MHITKKLLILICILCSAATHCAWHLGPQCNISPKIAITQSSDQPSRVVYDAIKKNNKLQPFTPLQKFKSPEITLPEESLSAKDRLKIVKDLQHARKNGPRPTITDDKKKPDNKTGQYRTRTYLSEEAIIHHTNEECKHAISTIILDRKISLTLAQIFCHVFSTDPTKDTIQNDILNVYEIKDKQYGVEEPLTMDHKTILIHEMSHAITDLAFPSSTSTPQYISNIQRNIKSDTVNQTIGGQYVWTVDQPVIIKDLFPSLYIQARVAVSGVIGQQICNLPGNSKRPQLYSGKELTKPQDILDLLLDEPIANFDAQGLIKILNIFKTHKTKLGENPFHNSNEKYYEYDELPDSMQFIKIDRENLSPEIINNICKLYKEQYAFLKQNKSKLLNAAEKYKDKRIIPCSELAKDFDLQNKSSYAFITYLSKLIPW